MEYLAGFAPSTAAVMGNGYSSLGLRAVCLGKMGGLYNILGVDGALCTTRPGTGMYDALLAIFLLSRQEPSRHDPRVGVRKGDSPKPYAFS